MKKAALYSILTLATLTAHAENIKVKTLGQLRGMQPAYVYCESKGREQLHVSLKMPSSFGGGGLYFMDNLMFALIRPGEGLFARHYEGGYTTWYADTNSAKWTVRVDSTAAPGFDTTLLEVNDATNGKFKGKLTYSRQSPTAINLAIDVTCSGYNYSLPKPPQ